VTRTIMLPAALAGACLLPANAFANADVDVACDRATVELHGFRAGAPITARLAVGVDGQPLAPVVARFTGPAGSISVPLALTGTHTVVVDVAVDGATWRGHTIRTVTCNTDAVESTGGTPSVTPEPAEVSPPAPASPPTVVTTPPPVVVPRPRCVGVPGGRWTTRPVPRGRVVCRTVPHWPRACKRPGQVVTWTHARRFWRAECPPRRLIVAVTG
jgi:hypothetical protein